MAAQFSLQVDLLEQTDTWYLALDHQDKKEYLYKQRTGLLQRKANRDQIAKSTELSSLAEAKSLVSAPLPASALKTRTKEMVFNPDRILRENDLVLKAVQEFKPREWKVIVRATHTRRIIVKPGCKEKKTDFTFFSLLVKLKLNNSRNVIEVGEGSAHALKFNQDGICSRLQKMVENHTYSKAVPFNGKVPVVLNSGDGAIIFHELLGHSLEADYIFRGQSPVSRSDLQKPIVSANVTLVTRDPGDTFFKGISCDDEGEAAASSLLVEKGVLRSFIADRYYQEHLKLENCGHARVEDFSKIPMPRMFALYLKPGDFHPDELIAATKTGVYAGEFGEGKVFFHKDLFYFQIREAWLIRNGKLTEPLGTITVRGSIREVLNSVDMVANDFRFDKGISYCFKNGQTVNVRVGQPTVKINNLYITGELDD